MHPPAKDSARMTPRDYARRNRRLIGITGVLIGLAVLLLRHGEDMPGVDGSGSPGVDREVVSLRSLTDLAQKVLPESAGLSGAAPRIHEVTVVRQGHFEAILKVRYSVTEQHAARRGYLYLFERENAGNTGVGAFMQRGTHTARVFLNRRLAHPQAHQSGQVAALMYRYGSSDPAFFEQDLALRLSWPALPEVEVQQAIERYPGLRQLQLFRNIPRYEELAMNLVRRGFPGGQVTILYAPCGKCRAGLHFGRQVQVGTLQEILRALRSHEFPVRWVDYDASPQRTGQILVGWTPSKHARPLWQHRDALLAEGLTMDEFADIVGLDIP